MYVVTNREVLPGKDGVLAFGDKPSCEGPNELRFAEAKLLNRKWEVQILNDQLGQDVATAEGIIPLYYNHEGQPIYVASQLVAKNLYERLRKDKRNLVVFVHGYNNDMNDVLTRAYEIENIYNVEVLVFSWPANGGGRLTGAASYLSDKRDAIASIGALSRVFNKMADYLDIMNREIVQNIENSATAVNFDNDEAWNTQFTKSLTKICPFRITLVMHSMGNYLLKHMQKSSVTRLNRIIFDNIILIAADVNNEDHKEWVETIPFRERLFITINEDDGALRASRMKVGEHQKARLGHYRFNLSALNAIYSDFTSARYVGSDHSYFIGKATRNEKLKKFFHDAFNGLRAESMLKFDPVHNTYMLK